MHARVTDTSMEQTRVTNKLYPVCEKPVARCIEGCRLFDALERLNASDMLREVWYHIMG